MTINVQTDALKIRNNESIDIIYPTDQRKFDRKALSPKTIITNHSSMIIEENLERDSVSKVQMNPILMENT